MNLENEWDFIWRRQKLPEGKSADIATLLANFEAQRKKQARTLWLRDYGEASAALLGAVAFGAIACKIPELGWWIWPAVLLVLGVGSVFVRERLRARKLQPDSAKPLLEKLDADIAELRHQQKLIGKIHLWYLAPIAIAILLVLIAMILKATQANEQVLHEPLVRSFLAGYVLLCAGLFFGVWKLNRHALHKRIAPRLDELIKIRSHLRGETQKN